MTTTTTRPKPNVSRSYRAGWRVSAASESPRDMPDRADFRRHADNDADWLAGYADFANDHDMGCSTDPAIKAICTLCLDEAARPTPTAATTFRLI